MCTMVMAKVSSLMTERKALRSMLKVVRSISQSRGISPAFLMGRMRDGAVYAGRMTSRLLESLCSALRMRKYAVVPEFAKRTCFLFVWFAIILANAPRALLEKSPFSISLNPIGVPTEGIVIRIAPQPCSVSAQGRQGDSPSTRTG